MVISRFHGNQPVTSQHRTTGQHRVGGAARLVSASLSEFSEDPAEKELTDEVTLETLKTGDTFRLLGTGTSGILASVNRASARVILDNRTKSRTIKKAGGETVTFMEGGEAVGWAPATMVVHTGHDADRLKPTGSKKAEVDKGLQVRWAYQVKQLHNFLEAGNDEMAEAVRDKINYLARQAEEKGTRLRKADYDDPVFEGMDEILVASEQTSVAAKEEDAVSEKNKEVKTAKAAKPKVEKVKVVKTAKEKTDCLCGCGKKVSGRFSMGHDSTYKSLILKVMRGKLEAQNLPKKMREELKFVSAGKGTFRCTNAQAKLPEVVTAA